MNAVLLWIIAGSVLCLMELFLPTAFVALMMGISAIAVALIALVVPSFGLQVSLWLILSTLFVIASRRFVPKRSKKLLEHQDAIEAEALTPISRGKSGRVLYEGNSWRAECQDQHITITTGQKVYVVSRKGNTLIVYPTLE
ncbi:MAG: NfeD family protein [Snowella sp.]|nr:NfeD family protein [Snowella sp.]